MQRFRYALLQRADSTYSVRVRSIYSGLGNYLAARVVPQPGKAALAHMRDAQKKYWKVFWDQPEIADSIVRPSQRELTYLELGVIHAICIWCVTSTVVVTLILITTAFDLREMRSRTTAPIGA
jgi:hypothetical protein